MTQNDEPGAATFESTDIRELPHPVEIEWEPRQPAPLFAPATWDV